MLIKKLVDKKLLTPPVWMAQNTSYLCTMGSVAYGVAEDTSDFDVYGFCIPPKSDIFPYQEKLYGFDSVSVFEQFQQHHVFDQNELGGKGREYDFTIFSIVKYFKLLVEGNPNIIDSLFVPQSCILHSTRVFEMVRDNRKLFLSKRIWPRFKGYSMAQMHKMGTKNYQRIQPVMKFEKQHKIPSSTTFEDVKKEMEKRGFIA